jgi:hypothetical protein
MADPRVSLKPLLLGDVPSAAIAACTDEASATARRGLAAVPQLDWASLSTDIGKKISEMFDIPLIGVMLGAWRDLRELRDAIHEHSTDAGFDLPLFDHTLEVSFEPHLDIAVSGMRAVRIDFEIGAEIELAGIVVTIKGAAIRALRIGSCEAKATVKCEGVTIFERSLRKIDLPGEIDLSYGIPIGAPTATARGSDSGRLQ